MSKRTNIILIVILSIFSLVLIAALVLGIIFYKNTDHFFVGGFKMSEKDIVKEESYELTDIENIDIDLVSADVTILPSEDGKIKIVEYSKRDLKEDQLFKVSKSNDSLYIEDNRKDFFFICFGNCSSEYKIYLPLDYKDNLNIKGSSSDIKITNKYTFNNLKLSSVSGDIVLDKTKTKKATFKTTSGEIKLKGFESKTTNITTTSGDIEADMITSDIDVSTVSGDVDIDNVTGKITAKTTSGDIKLYNYKITANSKFNTVSGEVNLTMSEDSNCEINTKSVSGDTSLPNSSHVIGNPPYYKIDIKTTSGDMKITKK